MRKPTSMAITVGALCLMGAAQASAVSFTVAPGAAGGPGAACALGPADVCNSPKNGTNVTYALAAVLGLVPGDVVDALSFNTTPPHPPAFPAFGVAALQFSVAPGAAGGVGFPGPPDPAAIYRSAGAGTVVDTTSAALGLAVGDDVDGYENLNVPSGGATAIFFSLAPGSPSLGGAFTPGDILLVVPGGGAFGLFINAESLGLCTVRSGCPSDDDLDALIVNTDAWVNVGLPWPTLQSGNGLLFSVAPGAIGPGLPGGTLPGDALHSLGGGVSTLYAAAAAMNLAAADNLDALEVYEGPDHNHFKVYDVEDVAVPIPVILNDQFGENLVTDPLLLDLFANPVDKNEEGMATPDEHQRWYLLAPPDPPWRPRQVTYSNQFGRRKLRVGDPRYLVVPSQKEAGAFPGTCTAPPASVGNPCVRHSDCDSSPGAGDGVCGGLNHFECYEVTWAPAKEPRIVQLEDQFGVEADVLVGEPRYFCNPAAKTAGPDYYPIEDPDNHLVCYDIEPKIDHAIEDLTTEDQFGPQLLQVHTNELLCVPSTKEGFDLPTMGRWGFATLIGLLMLMAGARVGYRRRLAPDSAA